MNLFIGLFTWSDIAKLQVPEGFEIQEFVTEIDDARQMVEGSNFIFVGTKSAGNVYAIDKNNANKVSVILKELDMPTGVALKNGNLYIAETDTIHVVKTSKKNSHRIKKSPPKFSFLTSQEKPCGILSQRDGMGGNGSILVLMAHFIFLKVFPVTFAMKMIQDTEQF